MIYTEQRAVIYFFTLMIFRSRAAAAELQSVCETETFSLPIVKKWLKHFAEERTAPGDDPRSGKQFPNDFADASSSMLKERPNLSCNVLCWDSHIAKAACLRILLDRIGMEKSNLHYVPRALDMNQKAEKPTLSYEILSPL
jgi:hypothetical protein